ncbi:MAG: alginate export family protein [Nitrospinae bacterium]|nr:alginate export family protein [Nitrospinota bacterium]
MKRNFLTAIAVMVTAFFVGTTIAQAADISFSGQIRPRFEANQQGDFTDTTDTNYSFSTRVRLNAKVNVNSDTSVFIQLQSVGVWGSTPANTSGTRQSTGGGGNEANDQLSDVGLHQAYFTLKNFAGMPADLKVGRQEVVLDGHRLLGNTGWTQGAETKDAIRLTHSEGNHTLAYVFIKGLENGVATGPFADGGTSTEDDNDVNIHVFWGNLKGGPLGGELSGYFVIIDDNATGSGGAVGAGAENTFYTVGARQKGKFMGLDYRAEYYYQFGEAGGDASGAGYTSAYSQGSAFSAPIDRSAYMIGVRVGKTFSNVMWKPTLTLWYDHLSGTDADDIRRTIRHSR